MPAIKMLPSADTYFDDFKARAGKRHGHITKLASITPISATGNKVHLDVQINRFDAQDQLSADASQSG